MKTTKTVQQVLNESMSEKQFQAMVIELATHLGYMVYHTYDSRRCTPGFPDIVATRNGRTLFIELKKESGRLSPAQHVWLTALRACQGIEVYVWKPHQWDEIEEVLKK